MKDTATVLDIILREMETLKSDFDNKIIALYSGYLDQLENIRPTRRRARKLFVVQITLDMDLHGDLNRIQYFTSVSYNYLAKIYQTQEINDNYATSLRELVLTFCESRTTLLWDTIGEADRRIKEELAKNGFPVQNRIKIKVEITVPNKFETRIINAVQIHAATKNLAEIKIYLWQTTGFKIAAEIMQKEEARVEKVLKTLANDITRRVERARPNSNKTIDMFFQKFEDEIVNFHRLTQKLIDAWFIQPKSKEVTCENRNDMTDILDCLKENTKTVASNMEFNAERVVKLALVLNYLLEMINQ